LLSSDDLRKTGTERSSRSAYGVLPGARPMGAARTKNTYFAARFHRLAAKRGSKRAVVPIGHKILVLTHYLLQHNCPFRELGADYYLRLRAPSLSQSIVRRWQRLGYQVTLTPVQQAI
jgi:transposase